MYGDVEYPAKIGVRVKVKYVFIFILHPYSIAISMEYLFERSQFLKVQNFNLPLLQGRTSPDIFTVLI
jgi:hypothetical protein